MINSLTIFQAGIDRDHKKMGEFQNQALEPLIPRILDPLIL